MILENEMERTRRLFCEFFPFFVQFFQFGIVCIFFQCKFLTFDRIGIDFFLRHQLVDFHISFFQNSNSVFRLFQFILLPAVPFVPASLVWSLKVSIRWYFEELSDQQPGWRMRRSVLLFSPDSNHSFRYNRQKTG